MSGGNLEKFGACFFFNRLAVFAFYIVFVYGGLNLLRGSV